MSTFRSFNRNNKFTNINREKNFTALSSTRILKTSRVRSLPSIPGSVGNIIYNKTDKQFYGSNGTSWISLSANGGGGSGGDQWTPFTVSTPATQSVYNSSYTTIQSAVDAAALNLGAGSGRRLVLITPGVYNETVTVANGIDLLAADSQYGGVVPSFIASALQLQAVEVAGLVIPAVSGFFLTKLAGIKCTGTLDVTGGSSATIVSLLNCTLQNNSPIVDNVPSGTFATIFAVSSSFIGDGGLGTLTSTRLSYSMHDCSIESLALIGPADPDQVGASLQNCQFTDNSVITLSGENANVTISGGEGDDITINSNISGEGGIEAHRFTGNCTIDMDGNGECFIDECTTNKNSYRFTRQSTCTKSLNIRKCELGDDVSMVLDLTGGGVNISRTNMSCQGFNPMIDITGGAGDCTIEFCNIILENVQLIGSASGNVRINHNIIRASTNAGTNYVFSIGNNASLYNNLVDSGSIDWISSTTANIPTGGNIVNNPGVNGGGSILTQAVV